MATRGSAFTVQPPHEATGQMLIALKRVEMCVIDLKHEYNLLLNKCRTIENTRDFNSQQSVAHASYARGDGGGNEIKYMSLETFARV